LDPRRRVITRMEQQQHQQYQHQPHVTAQWEKEDEERLQRKRKTHESSSSEGDMYESEDEENEGQHDDEEAYHHPQSNHGFQLKHVPEYDSGEYSDDGSADESISDHHWEQQHTKTPTQTSHSSSSSSDAEVKTSTPKAAAAISTNQKSATTDKINTPPSSPNTLSKSEQNWMKMYHRLQQYKDQYNDCLVPVGYTADKKLSDWVKTQRRTYKLSKIKPHRRTLLTNIDFVWEINPKTHTPSCNTKSEQRWNTMFHRLKRYKILKGDCFVPQQQDYDDVDLHVWTQNQRKAYKANGLRNDRKDLLDSIGFDLCLHWKNKDSSFENEEEEDSNWDEMFQRLGRYKEAHGNCHVPLDYVDDRVLSAWVFHQRTLYKVHSMASEKQTRLESLGFAWNVDGNNTPFRQCKYDLQWDEMFRLLYQYKQQYGDCQVPQHYVEDPKLGAWMSTQRVAYKAQKMKANRKYHLESIGFVFHNEDKYNASSTSKPGMKWDEMYHRLQCYKQQYGNCLVPCRYVGDEPLAEWVKTQRRAFRFKKLKPERQRRLDSIGFIWDTAGTKHAYASKAELKWDEMFHCLTRYKAQYGDCLVEQNHVQYQSLAAWCQCQRQNSRCKVLKAERKERLDSIGFVWHVDIKNRKWDEMFHRLQRYKEQHGDCLVPPNYEEDKMLAAWVQAHASSYKSRSLKPEKRQLFDSLEVEWGNDDKNNIISNTEETTDIREVIWDEWFQRLKHYKEQYGDCHVKKCYPGESELSDWVKAQRRVYRLGRMKAQRKAKLESIEFEWDVNTNRVELQWHHLFRRLQRYKEHNGNCLVSQKYAKDKLLAAWVHNQRDAYESGSLTAERRDLLESMDFSWHVDRKMNEWDEMFRRLQRYKELHGHCAVPLTYAQDKKLGAWVQTQRCDFEMNKIKDEKEERLNSLGFVWDVDLEDNTSYNSMAEQRWDDMFHRLQRYKQEYGDCLVPMLYAEDRSLGDWVKTQRRVYKDNRMKAERKERLESIGFVWNVDKKTLSHTSKADQKWDEMFHRLSRYKQQYGDCLVPHTYVHDRLLGLWVHTQRSMYKLKNMTSDKEERLNSIGFEWNANENVDDSSSTSVSEMKWNEMFSRLEYYKEQYGDCLVKNSNAGDKSLCEWVKTQRRAYKSDKMKTERQKRLESIGFEWNTDGNSTPSSSDSDQKWNGMFNLLLRYKYLYGHFLVPKNDANYEGLAEWIKNQREANKVRRIRVNREKKLNSIGFIWNSKETISEWDVMFDRLQRYKQTYGDCLVPKSYVRDRALGAWVREQRNAQKSKTLVTGRRLCLQSLDFVWNVDGNVLKWNEMARCLYHYKESNGNCLVPTGYAEHKALGEWVKLQRKTYKSGKLKGDRQRHLESIGFVWNVSSRKS